MVRSILKQASWLFFAQALTRVISFFYIVFLARSLGVSDFGFYTVALAYFSIISAVADFGFNRFLVREVAKDHLKAAELLSNIAILRLTLTSVIFAVFAIVLYFLDQDKFRVSLTLLAVLAILPQSLALTVDGLFVALKKLKFSAVALFLASLFTALLGFILVNQGFASLGAINALLLGQLVYAVILVVMLVKNQGLLLSNVSFSMIKKALVGSLPYGLLGVLGLLYFRIDAVMLAYLKGGYEAGLYGAAYKFLEASIFIPGSFSVALFPVLAKLHDENKSEMKKIYYKSLKIMAVFGVALLLIYLLVLPVFIKLFLPDYLLAISAINILAFSIPFIFIATPGVQVLFSSDKYLKTVILLSVLTVVFNIVLNFIFIPKYGFLGAAYTTVASDILSFIVFYLLIVKKIFANEKH